MKAISIKQPYAEWIRLGRKTLEIRSWKTNYRGSLIVCSSLSKEECSQKELDLLRGYAICEVELINIVEFKKKHEELSMVKWKKELFAWEFKIIRTLEPQKIIGKMGIFDIDL